MRAFFLRVWRKFVKLFQSGKTRGNDFYINGPDTLPPPLSPEAEAEALLRLGEEPSQAQLLIEHNLRLVVYIARKFENTGFGIEDLISIGTIGLIKAVKTYRCDKNIKLATYASRCIENEILMYIRKNGVLRFELSIDEPLNVDWDGNELLLSDVLSAEDDQVGKNLEKAEEEKLLKEAVMLLDEREREIIEFRYGLGGKEEKTQKEVADMMGISQSYISRLEKKILQKLRGKVSGETFFAVK